MKKIIIGFAAVAVCLTIFSQMSCKPAQSTTKSISKTDSVSMTDAELYNKTYSYLIINEQSATNALTNSTSQEVQAYSKDLKADYGTLREEFRKFAKQRNITLNEDLTTEMNSMNTDLTKLSGRDYDKQYAKTVDATQTDLSNSLTKLSNASDPEIKKWATEISPLINSYSSKTKDFSDKISQIE
ncbi:hypothetical protein C3K47_09425 [Solitalea longa]|uniref:DUF4142 domain-containing protein n=1 Tax=Solitalea longa TaxID=2079460 RepID=A0A2S5A1Y6_9SPHI|nr:DUF4142 domain-containing protein [Solitalea longa]POY36586.1 hypothetical protein C3K47_09425 [Solitalea longa]